MQGYGIPDSVRAARRSDVPRREVAESQKLHNHIAQFDFDWCLRAVWHPLFR